ncbi:hypothetical protein [Desulfogranum marinum]|uniref:hypothetical protein n=1 Tax=Desulfogranum marinum TaxID=453220 RepID=UPI001964C486|nr:hypothetical protein [Desulfogranum marinum]MBM9511883.1 hypothetical protein [Desulfogranum marinum]
MVKIIRNVIAAIVFVFIGILIASNYEVRILEVSDGNNAMVKAGELVGKVAFDFKFVNKHVVILKK